MRVLVVSHLYPRHSSSGSGLFIHRLNRALVRQGIEVHVLQRADWAPPWPLSTLRREWREYRDYRSDLFEDLDGVRIHHPETVHPRPSRFFDPDIWERQVRTLVRYVRRRPELMRADAVIGHFLVPDGYHAVRLAQSLGIPSAAMAWGDDVHAWPEGNEGWCTKLRSVLAECDQLVACSRKLATDGAAWANHHTSWEVVYAGTDLDRFHPPAEAERRAGRALPSLGSLPDDSRILLMIGQPVTAKGYLELFDAWQVVHDDDGGRWRLVMVGANWGNVDVPAEIARRGLSDSARWLGPQPADAIPILMQASDAFVLPSHNEGLSLSVMEAMATGLPVVATDVGGHREILRHGENGWLIPARNVEALARALRELMTDPADRSARGHAARTTIEAIGAPNDSAGRLAKILRDLIARGTAASVPTATVSDG